jgi:serine protease Do
MLLQHAIEGVTKLFVLSLAGLGLCSVGMRASAQATAPPSASVPATPAAPAPPSINILVQIEDAVTAIVQAAAPSVVTIEGNALILDFLPLGAPATQSLGAPGVPPGNGQTAEGQPPEATLEQNLKKSWKSLSDTPTTGSGFVMQGGYVVTSAEVTEGMQSPTVILQDGRRLTVDWINADACSNICVLKVAGLPSEIGLRWGDSDRARPGAFAIAIVNQGGFPNSVSLGVIAGVDRRGQSGVRQYDHLIQVQMAVGGGSSGGPVLNAHGEVIGMLVGTPAGGPVHRMRILDGSHRYGSYGKGRGGPGESGANSSANPAQRAAVEQERTARYAEIAISNVNQTTDEETSGASADKDTPAKTETDLRRNARASEVMAYNVISTTGFAIPSNDLKRVTQLLLTGAKLDAKPKRGWLGVQIGSTEENRGQPGALIVIVYDNGPADRAGMQPGDIVLAVDGQPLLAGEALKALSLQITAGQTLHLLIRRRDKTLTLNLTAHPRPADDAINHMHMRMRETGPKTGSMLVPNDSQSTIG